MADLIEAARFQGTEKVFGAFYALQSWAGRSGVALGAMQAAAPIGLMLEDPDCDYAIPKWRNMTKAERELLDGRVVWTNGGPRDGTAVVMVKPSQVHRLKEEPKP